MSNKAMVKEAKFIPSGLSYEKKCKIVNAIRARIIADDTALAGLLTFVSHNVVKEGHPAFEDVAYTTGDQMFFCDRFFSQEVPIMCAIVLHEMFHIVFRHVQRGRGRIHNLFNLAADAIINDSIGYKEDASIDSGAQKVYLEREHAVSLQSLFEEAKVPEDERKPLHEWTTEGLYEYLIKNYKKQLEEQAQQQQGNGGQGQGEGEGQAQGKGQGQGQGKQKGKGKGSGSQAGKSMGGMPGAGSGGSVGGQGQRSNTPLGRVEAEIDKLLERMRQKHSMFNGTDIDENGDDGVDPANEEINNAIWTERFNRAKQMGAGRNTILGKVNPDVYKSVIPWHKELRKYLNKRCMPNTVTTWTKPARRTPALKRVPHLKNIYLPGFEKEKGLDKMAVVIDTSGSCFNEEELTMFCTEIDSIQKKTGVEIALVFADEDVEAEYIVKNDGTGILEKMKKGHIKAAGGGGTNMVTPFLYVKKKYKPVVTVIASDGYTPFPTRKQIQGTSLIWVINTDAEVPKGSGKALRIHPKDN